MRVLTACLVGFLGLGALVTMAACSDSSDGSMAGAGGGSAAGGSSTAGNGGAPPCGFTKPACQACLNDKCKEKLDACIAIDSCATALVGDLQKCVCAPGSDPQACVATFYSENGDPGEELTDCYSTNCNEACQ
jgi:hypothetical protein